MRKKSLAGKFLIKKGAKGRAEWSDDVWGKVMKYEEKFEIEMLKERLGVEVRLLKVFIKFFV